MFTHQHADLSPCELLPPHVFVGVPTGPPCFPLEKSLDDPTQTQPSFSHGIQCFHFIFKINDLYPPEVEQRFCHRKVTNFSPISEAGSSSFPTIFQGRAVKLREGNQSKIDSNDSTLHDLLGRCLVRNCVFCCFFWGGMELVESPDAWRTSMCKLARLMEKQNSACFCWLEKLTWVRVQGLQEGQVAIIQVPTCCFFFKKWQGAFQDKGRKFIVEHSKAACPKQTAKQSSPKTINKTMGRKRRIVAENLYTQAFCHCSFQPTSCF